MAITYYRNQLYSTYVGTQKNLIEIACLSTDTKPTQDIVTGSLALEVNTGKIFAFDEVSGNWSEI